MIIVNCLLLSCNVYIASFLFPPVYKNPRPKGRGFVVPPYFACGLPQGLMKYYHTPCAVRGAAPETYSHFGRPAQECNSVILSVSAFTIRTRFAIFRRLTLSFIAVIMGKN